MKTGYIMAIDQGSTATKVLLVDHNLSVKASSNAEFVECNPKPGWVEIDPLEIWRSVHDGIRKVLTESGARSSEIKGIGITNQRETVMMWNRVTGEPLTPAISWKCKRAVGICERVSKKQGAEELIRNKTGLFLDSYYSAPKIAWLLDNFPGLRDQCEIGSAAVGTVDSWIIFNLSGRRSHVTDMSNASRTLMYNVVEKKWDDELLALWGIPKCILPDVKASSDDFGVSDASITGSEIPITGCIGDSQGALFGQCAFEIGIAKNTYGTAANFDVNIGEKFILSKHNLQTTIAWGIDGKVIYALEGGIYVAGAIVEWFRDKTGFIANGKQADEMAESMQDNDGVYFVPGFVGLGAPHWDQYARGTIFGLSNATTKSALVRAGLESVVYQVNDVLECAQSDIGSKITSIKTDGGFCKSDFILQYQADISDVEVVRPAIVDTTALGATFLAGLKVGFWRDTAEISGLYKIDRVFKPNMDPEKRAYYINNWNKAVKRSLHWLDSNS